MTMKNTQHGYGRVARWVHWLMAFAIFAMFFLGIWMRDLSYTSPYYRIAPDLHRSVGMVLLALLIFRLIWKLINIEPSTNALTSLEKTGSKVAHWALYVLLFALMIAGYLISTLDGRSIIMFGVIEIPSLFVQKGLESSAGRAHFVLAIIVIGLASFHALAALWHHFVKRDDVLTRMLKGSN